MNSAAEGRASEQRTTISVLILEDEPDHASLLTRALQRAGFAVHGTRVETEAEFVGHLDPLPDLILADYALPQFSGVDALRALRARGLAIPFIVVTGALTSEEAAVVAFHEGADDYLLKDRLGRLGQAVRRALEQHRLKQENLRAERALRDSERRFRALIEQSADAVLLVSADYTISYASPAVSRMLGYAANELERRNALELLHVEELAKISTAVEQLLRTPGMSFSGQARCRHRDGTWVWVEGTSTNLLKDPSVAGIVLNFRDITARRRSDEQLHFQTECLRALADISRGLAEDHLHLNSVLDATVRRTADILGGSVVLRLAVDDNALEVAAAYPPKPTIEHFSGAVGLPHDLVHDSGANVAVAPLSGTERLIGTLESSRQQGEPPYSDDDRRFLRDVADRTALALENARLHEAAQAALQARDEFLSIAAHELRTPVTVIQGGAQLLGLLQREGHLDAQRLQESVLRLERGAVRLARLTEALLDVSRLDGSKLQLHTAELNLAKLVTRIVELFQLQASAGTPLDVTGGDTVCMIIADESRVEEILSNLLSNAVKYSPEGGEISVRVEPKNTGYEVTVQDHGIGIPAEALECIYRPFGRAANATECNLPGMGLGLYICRQLAELHGGHLWGESPGAGLGATMHLWLPANSTTRKTDGAKRSVVPRNRVGRHRAEPHADSDEAVLAAILPATGADNRTQVELQPGPP
jgi:PAS domain S-box-containing protein